MKKSPAQSLCLACGLCCNGVIFADVKLRRGESPALRKLIAGSSPAEREHAAVGVPSRSGAVGCAQPCPALHGCRCRVYADRPTHCRNFECLLLQAVQSGRLTGDGGLKVIGKARARVTRIRRWLRELGDADEHLPVAERVRRTLARAGNSGDEPKTAQLCSQLSLGMHDLNLMLREKFYPG